MFPCSGHTAETVYGTSVCIMLRLAGGGFGVVYADRSGEPDDWRHGYPTEQECKRKACECALNRLEHSGEKDKAEVKRLMQMVRDYMKSLGRPQPVQLELF